MNNFRRGMMATAAMAIVGALSISFAAAQDLIVVPTAPPAPRVEVVPVVPTGRVWQPGHWSYEKDNYDWREGKIVEPPRPGVTWNPGRWESRGSGWVYIEGGWQ